MKRKSLALLLVVAFLVTLLAACSGGDKPKPTDPPGSDPVVTQPGESLPTEAPEPGEPKIFYDWTTSRSSWSPHNYTNSRILNVFSTMVGIVSSVDGSDQLLFVPHDTEELPYSEDGGKTWICKFRDDLEFTDGTPINAKTYEYSMKMLVDPLLVNKNASYLFDPCVVTNAKEYYLGECDWEDVGVKVKDDLTLEISLTYPATEIDFYTTLGSLIWPVHEELYEKGMNEDRTSTTYGTDMDMMESCGPFYLKDWVLDGYEILARNDKNPLVKAGYYFLDEVNTRYVSENATRWQMFQNGELDWGALSGDNYEANKNDPRAVKAMSPNVWGIFVNGASKNEIMHDNDFRLALYYSAPRVAVATEVYVLYDSPNYMIAKGISVTGSDGVTVPYRETAKAKAIVEKFSDNDDKALELFEAAYERNGNKKITVELTYFDGQEAMKRTGEVCQEKWEGLFGSDRFELKLRAVQPMQAYDNYELGDYDLGTGVDLANEFNRWASMVVWTSDYANPTITGFASEEFDKLYHETMYGELLLDADARIDALARMEEILMDYCVFIPTMENNNTWLVSERVELPTYTYLPWVSYGFFQSDIYPD